MNFINNEKMPETLMDIFNRMIEQKEYIYNKDNSTECPVVNSFDEINAEKLEKIFDSNGKPYFFSKMLKKHFSKSNKAWRCQHSFSVYLLGIYIYNSIPYINKAIANYISEYIYPYIDEMEKDPSSDFLYLWYPIALYHDMGYFYEDHDVSKKQNLKNIFQGIIETVSDEKNCVLDEELREPKELWNCASRYFDKRLNTVKLSHRQRKCIDHGLASGFNLYRHMRDVHYSHTRDNFSISCHKKLLYSRRIFKWFNALSAWTITCHNIQMAKKGEYKAKVFKEEGLEELICQKNESFINVIDHPLLFLLDFIDTIDPFKRFDIDGLDNIEICCPAENEVSFRVLGCNRSCCSFAKDILGRISKDLDFLKSETFHVRVSKGNNSITFMFG